MGGPSMVNEERQKVRVLAVDPAPGKGSTVFDGTAFSMKTGSELRTYLNEPGNRTRGTLVCWDAPLTGPTNPASAGACPVDFTQRLIEQFFSRAETGFKTPRGISVMPYSGCSHWTISRSLLGTAQKPDRSTTTTTNCRFTCCRRVQTANVGGGPRSLRFHPGVAAWAVVQGTPKTGGGNTRRTSESFARCGQSFSREHDFGGQIAQRRRITMSSTPPWAIFLAAYTLATGPGSRKSNMK